MRLPSPLFFRSVPPGWPLFALAALLQAPAFAGGPLHYSACKITITVNDDGSDTRLSELSWNVPDQDGVRQTEAVPVYASSTPVQATEVLRAETILPDGHRIAASMLGAPQGIRPYKLQQVVPGSRIELVTRVTTKNPVTRGNYYLYWSPPPAINPLGCEVNAIAAGSMPIRVASQARADGGASTSATAAPDGRRHWKWTIQDSSVPGLPDYSAANLAHVELSTFKDDADRSAAMQKALEQRRPEVVADAATAPNRPPPAPGSLGIVWRPPGIAPDFSGPPAEPEPEWIKAETAFYRDLLSKGRFDTLVLPVQTRGFGLDRTVRAIMAAELAAALRERGNARIPDTFLVARALGEGRRSIDLEEAVRLADSIGARQVVAVYAGHDGNGKLQLTLASLSRAAVSPPFAARGLDVLPFEVKSFDELPFGGATPVISAFESSLPKLRAALGLPPRGVKPGAASTGHAPALPTTLAGLVHGLADPAQQVDAFALLANMTPAHLDDARSRFEAKAYLASLQVPASSPARAEARARALMLANLREAALAALPHPQTAAERELIATLNGDLAGIASAQSREANPLKRLIGAFDESATRADYEIKPPDWPDLKLKALQLPTADWNVLAGRALRDSDPWLRADSVPLKRLLDAEFPVKGSSLADLQTEMGVFGNSGAGLPRVGLAVQAHQRQFIAADPARWCCLEPSNAPTELDALDLIEAIARDDLVRPLHLVGTTQDRPEEALRMAQALEPTLRGEPYFEVRRAQIEFGLSSRAPREQRAALSAAGYEHASGAYAWSQGQTKVASMAYEIAGGARPQGFFDNTWSLDRPMRPWYRPFAGTHQPIPTEASLREGVASATSQFRAFQDLAWFLGTNPDGEAKLRELEHSVEGRFKGCPRLSTWMAEQAAKRGDLQAMLTAYREAVRAAPDYWPGFYRLGELLTITGKPEEGAKTMSSFSGFAPASKFDRVLAATFASEGASLFYWAGRLDLAEPLLKISAGSHTSSAAEMVSKQRLQMIDGRLDLAAEHMQERAQGYRDADAYADYLSLLQAAGHAEDAWRGFDVLMKDLMAPELLHSAMVGQRMGKLSERQVIDWSRKGDWRGTEEVRSLAAWHLARSAVTDRTPGNDVTRAVDQLDEATWKIDDPDGWTIRAMRDPVVNYIVGPKMGDDLRSLPHGALERYAKHRIRSDLSYFVQAYAELKHGDNTTAAKTFKEASSYYDINRHEFAHMNPYLTLAQVRAGLAADARSRLDPTPFRNQGMDYLLSKAIVEAAAGHVDAAREALSLARYRIYKYKPRVDLPEYTFADIGMALVDSTHDSGIRAIVLDWARKYEVIEPWHAWSYAVEAVLATEPDRLQHAIAMAFYLDPASERLKKFSAPEIAAAVKAQAGRNPFLSPLPDNGKAASISVPPSLAAKRG